MKFWQPDRSDTAPDISKAIGCIGTETFSDVAVESLFPRLRSRHLVVYSRSYRSAPRLITSGSLGAAAITIDCWRAYLATFAKYDPIWSTVSGMLKPETPTVIGLIKAEGIGHADFRNLVYRRHGLQSRLSVYGYSKGRDLVACNLYRAIEDGDYSDEELTLWSQVAPSLLAAAVRHGELCSGAFDGAEVNIEGVAERRLLQVCPALSNREREVCAQLVAGRAYKAIAASLHVTTGTVKTYRERAFSRIGVRSREELLATLFRTENA